MENKTELEQAAEKEIKFLSPFQDDKLYKQGFIDGAKFQSERMFSEEDLLDAFEQSRLSNPMVGWKHDNFEQYYTTKYGKQ